MFNRLAIIFILALSLLAGSAVAPSIAHAKGKSSSRAKTQRVKSYTTKKGKPVSGYFRSKGK
ncbi:MAG TPA: hypothetical protein VND64_25300 [Pirellulales bacterium]|nr:hypothetical protein [Pirellulales bacterium]